MEVRRGVGQDHAGCLTIIAASPQYFHPTVLSQVARDLAGDSLFVAREGTSVVGFCTVRDRGGGVCEITWLAVFPPRRGLGFGGQLLRHVERESAATGAALLTVKTLAPTAPDLGYARTRRFYERAGFRLVEIIDPYPGWEPGSPCAIYVKPLGA